MLTVTVVLALPGRAVEVETRLPQGSTVADALSAFPAREAPGMDLAHAPVGVWGRRVERDRPLADGDRVEIYRPLVADPKSARRRKARRQQSVNR
jgi:putative ubiquitin-RnfH superfamily antitoxin RatB of RatAB toxin-antitoxin module